MIVTKTHPDTKESVSRSIKITPELLHEIRIEVLNGKSSLIQSGKLDHLAEWEIVFLYTGKTPDFTGMSTEQKAIAYLEGIKNLSV
jgi:hypothetical protein